MTWNSDVAYSLFFNVFPLASELSCDCLQYILLRNIIPFSMFTERKSEVRSRIDRDSDNHQLLQLEEKDVVSSVATVLSDLCGPGEWMPMGKLHAEVSSKTSDLTRIFELLCS